MVNSIRSIFTHTMLFGWGILFGFIFCPIVWGRNYTTQEVSRVFESGYERGYSCSHVYDVNKTLNPLEYQQRKSSDSLEYHNIFLK